MKRASLGAVMLLVAVLVGCGGSNSSSTSSGTSGLKARAYVSNSFSGSNSATADSLIIVDATKDQISNSHPTIGGLSSVLNGPSLMSVSPGREITMVFNSGNNSISVISNSTETIAGALIPLGGATDSIAAKDATTGYAAVRNASVSGQSDLGGVLVLDLGTQAVSQSIGVPRARRLVLSHNGAKLAVFSDDADFLTIIDTAAKTATTIGGFDRPANGVFSSDDSTLFVLNCGPECGGATASVQPLTISGGTAGAAVPVSAATVALLNGTTLYVAGSAGGALGNGKLDVLSITNNVPAVTTKGVVIGDGLHTRMALASSNKLFIGARNCTNNPNVAGTGCLTIFDTGAGTAAVDPGRGDVTGLEPIANRNIVYVCEGGEFRIYDTTTNTISTGSSIDVVGAASDVKAIDQPQPLTNQP